MNLRAIANSVTCAINPNIEATLKQNNGFSYGDDGSQIPSYTESKVIIQVQALHTQDLMHLGDMAQQGQYCTVYINGLLDAQIRSLAKGEDLLIFNTPRENDTATWKVNFVAEGYSGAWTRGTCMQTVDYDTLIYTDVRRYLIGLLNCPVIRGRQNYSPLPEGCVVMQNINDEQAWQDYDDDGNVIDVVTRCMQLDFFGKDAGSRARLVATMWKTPYTCDALTTSSPLYCNNLISQQFVNEKGIYEDRYILDVFLQFQVNYEYNVDKTDQLSVEYKSMALKSIPASHIVKVAPSAIGTGGSAYNLNGVFITSTSIYPTRTYTSATDVGADLGTDSDAYKFAVIYFQGTTISTTTPSTLFVTRYNESDTAAKIIGATLKSKSLSDLKSIKGKLAITVDGTEKSVEIDLSGATSWSDGALTIGNALGLNCVFNSSIQCFTILSGTQGSGSSISYASGTTADALGLSSAAGATLDNETVADTATTAIERLKAYTLNFGGFTLDSTFTIDAIKSFAQYVSAQKHDLWFVAHTLEAQALIANNTETLGSWISENNISDTTLIYGDITEAALALGYMASLDFTRENGAMTLDFRNVSGLPARIVSEADATALESNGYMYYGGFATKASRFIFFRNSHVSGEFDWVDDYLVQLSLNGNIQNSILTGLVATGKVSYNALGKQKFRSFCTDPVNKIVNFGGIQTGVTLSDSQVQQINSLSTRFDVAKELFTKGWVLIIDDASPTVRSARGSFPSTLLYTSGGSVHTINLASVAVL